MSVGIIDEKTKKLLTISSSSIQNGAPIILKQKSNSKDQ